MTAPDTPRARTSWRGRWPGLVWAVPLAALGVVAYLGLQAFAQRGVEVVVTFDAAHGARAGDTPVVYKGVRIGRVTRIQISKDVRHVDMTLRLEPRTRDTLRDGAKFWMIGAQPSLTDLSSLTAVVSGVSIGASPGTGAPRRHFIGMDLPPPVPPDEQGSYYLLQGDDLGATRVGAGIYFQGLEVGRVTQLTLDPAQGFRLTAFVGAPYDRLVKPDSQFHGVKALDVQLSRSGLGARLGPGNSSLVGGVEFETPPAARLEPQSLSGATFRVFQDRDDAELGPAGPEVLYHAALAGGGALRPGAPVMLEGFPIGRVVSRALTLRGDDGQPAARLQIAIAPERLGLPDEIHDGAALSPDDWRARTDTALARLIRRGFRLQLTQSPPVLGPAALDLVRLDAPPPAPAGGLARGELPTAGVASLQSVITRADGLLRSAQAVPLGDIGRNLKRLTGRLDALAGSPELADSLAHLHATLASLDQITADVRPEAGPLAAKLVQAAGDLDQVAANANRMLGGGAPAGGDLPDTLRQVTAAARSLRALADDLDRHPEALLKGKGPP